MFVVVILYLSIQFIIIIVSDYFMLARRFNPFASADLSATHYSSVSSSVG